MLLATKYLRIHACFVKKFHVLTFQSNYTLQVRIRIHESTYTDPRGINYTLQVRLRIHDRDQLYIKSTYTDPRGINYKNLLLTHKYQL